MQANDAQTKKPDAEAALVTVQDIERAIEAILFAAGYPVKYEKLAEVIGLPLQDVKNIISELAKPGRDPRSKFEPPKFREDVTKIEDVREGMTLEGVVTNVTAFGAFVDIGVHQDGLIHLSELSDNFVTDPASVVKAGDRLKVTVIGVDVARQRISLSAKSNPLVGAARAKPQGGFSSPREPRRPRTSFAPSSGGGFSCNPFANL